MEFDNKQICYHHFDRKYMSPEPEWFRSKRHCRWIFRLNSSIVIASVRSIADKGSDCEMMNAKKGIWLPNDECKNIMYMFILDMLTEEDNLSPFDLNIACLCQSIEINNNKYVYRHSQVRKSTDSGAKWAECSLIIGTGCRVQVFSLILDSSVGLSASIQSTGD